MTVADLIAKLQEFDPGMEVFVDGYEEGADLAKPPCLFHATPHELSWWAGTHSKGAVCDKQQANAVIIER